MKNKFPEIIYLIIVLLFISCDDPPDEGGDPLTELPVLFQHMWEKLVEI